MMALIIAVAMVLGMTSMAWAAPGDFTGTAETTIEATNVKAGDSVNYIQLVEWDTTTSDWKLTTAGESCGVTLANLVDGITEAEAGTIAANVTATGTAMTAGTDPATTFTATVNPGLYYLRAIPAADNKDTLYNPAFVSADYYEGGNSVNFSSAYESSTVVKKSTVPFDKEVNSTTDNFNDVKPGDIVPFKVTTKIPAFGSSFTNPKFNIEDTLSAGLEIEGDVTVKYGETTITDSDANVVINKKADKTGYTVSFNKAYLTALNGATPNVEITYSAKVTTEGTNNVTYMDNTAKLTFSNSPNTEVNKEDKTRHYTFAIDGDLLGQSGKEGSELIKTGTDAQGNVLTENQKTYHETTVSALSGASFKLVGTEGTPTAGISITKSSDTNGRINFDGLDAGVYTLTEESAPTGFVKDTRTFTVTITPTYNKDVANYAGDEPDLLVSYEITITAPASGDTPAYNGGATFSMTNDGGVTVESTIESASNFINNTQGAELPSTGGIGTTIFYIVGAILVIGAGVILVTRRRMDA